MSVELLRQIIIPVCLEEVYICGICDSEVNKEE